MKYNRIAVSAVLILILCIFIIAFFCILAFSSSYGYSKKQNEIFPTANFAANSKVTIVIDAGHGGEDPGAVANGLIEKELNLSVAQKLEEFLSLSGYNVVMTRSDDRLLGDGEYNSGTGKKRADLNARLKMLENADNAVLVSIHMNKFGSETAHGLQTFYSTNNNESELLARSVQEASKLLDQKNNREIKSDTDSIYLLNNAYKPAVLVECGFISNKSEALKLADNKYQTQLAFVLYTGIVNYLGGEK